MIISIINLSRSLDDADVHKALRAINRQFEQDFEPYWSFGARLRLEGRSSRRPRRSDLADLRGDAIV